MERMPRRRTAREVSVAAKTRRRRSAKRGRMVRFIGRPPLLTAKLGFTVAKCGKENGSMIGLRVPISDPSFSSVPLCMDEEEEEE